MVVHTLCYVIADNDLEMSAIRDISRMILSNYEHNKNHCLIEILVKTKNSIFFVSIFKNLYVKELHFKNLDNFFAPKLLETFINRYIGVEEKLKTKTTKILIISGHNCGWYMYGKNSPYYTSSQILYLDNLRRAIEKNNIYLDSICFDTCFGSNIEVIMEFNHLADYFIGTPEYSYWEGLCNTEFCKTFSNSKFESVYENLVDLINNLVERAKGKEEPLSLSLVDNKKFAPIIDIVKSIKFQHEDFIVENSIDKCDIWLKDCHTGFCNPNECEVFYDLYNTIKLVSQRTTINFDNFDKIYQDAVKYTQNKYFKGVVSYGIDISLGFVDIFLVKQIDYIKSFKRLKAYEHLSSQK